MIFIAASVISLAVFVCGGALAPMISDLEVLVATIGRAARLRSRCITRAEWFEKFDLIGGLSKIQRIEWGTMIPGIKSMTGEPMRFTQTIPAAVAALVLSTSTAFAWDDAYKGDATHNPNSNVLMHEYKAANNCPAGQQPVMMGGVICCGEPNAGPYINRVSAPKKKVVRKYSAPVGVKGVYAPIGEKGVVYR